MRRASAMSPLTLTKTMMWSSGESVEGGVDQESEEQRSGCVRTAAYGATET